MSNNIDDILNVAAQDAVERVIPDSGTVRPIVITMFPPRYSDDPKSILSLAFRCLSLLPFVDYKITSENSIEISRMERLSDVSKFLKILAKPYIIMVSEIIHFKDISASVEDDSTSVYVRSSSLRESLIFDEKSNATVKNSNYFCWRNDIPKIAALYRLLLDGPVGNDEICSELMSHHFGCFLGMAELEMNENQVARKWMFPCHIVKDKLNFFENEELVGEKTVRFKENVTNSQIFDENPNFYEGAYTHAYIVTEREYENHVFVRSILLILVDHSRGEDSHVCVVKKNALFVDDKKIFNDENDSILKKFFGLCEKIGVHVPEADLNAILDELHLDTKVLNEKMFIDG